MYVIINISGVYSHVHIDCENYPTRTVQTVSLLSLAHFFMTLVRNSTCGLLVFRMSCITSLNVSLKQPSTHHLLYIYSISTFGTWH